MLRLNSLLEMELLALPVQLRVVQNGISLSVLMLLITSNTFCGICPIAKSGVKYDVTIGLLDNFL